MNKNPPELTLYIDKLYTDSALFLALGLIRRVGGGDEN